MQLAPETVTLGVLAGGRASRLGGLDKAWLRCHGQSQVLRIIACLAHRCGRVLVSANRGMERYAAQALVAVADRHADLGPIAGLDALAAKCETPWLFTVPVDVLDCDTRVLDTLAAALGQGAVARDGDGLQPLVALYDVAGLRTALARAIAAGQYSVQGLQQTMQLPVVDMHDLRFGNLNTPMDLQQAGYDVD